MAWLSWRQYRWQAIAMMSLLVVLGIVVLLLTLTGPPFSELRRACGSGSAAGGGFVSSSSACASLLLQYLTYVADWEWVIVAGVAIPALLGMFVGAPLIAREVQLRTHLLAWTQGVTRRRWFLVRVGLVLGSGLIAAALLAGVAQGWFAMQRSLGSVSFATRWGGFEIGPPVIIAYTIFALSLGVAASAAIRRTVPAMAVTLVGFIAVRVTVFAVARWRYLPPITARIPMSATPLSSGAQMPSATAWLVSTGTGFVNAAGQPVSASTVMAQCSSFTETQGISLSGSSGAGAGSCPFYLLEQWQPASRFWLFQGIEAAIFLVLALVLVALAYRLVMRLR